MRRRALVKMETHVSESMSNVNGSKMDDQQKREIKLTAKALSNKIEMVQKERKAKVNKMKEVSNAMRDLMQDDGNATQVRSQLDDLTQMIHEFTMLHQSLIPLIPEEEHEKQNKWFKNVLKCNNGVIEGAHRWLSEIGFKRCENVVQDVSTNVRSEQHVTHVSLHSVQDVGACAQEEISPNDSVSISSH